MAYNPYDVSGSGAGGSSPLPGVDLVQGSGNYYRDNGFYPGGPGDSLDYSLFDTTVKTELENSSIYRDALNLFSSDPKGQIWVQRLQAILASVQEPNVFISGGYGERAKRQEVLDNAYTQIKNLVSEFQQYKVSQPINQVDELSAAGINAAVTGQGVQGSQLLPNPVESNPSLFQNDPSRDNARDTLSTIGKFALNLSNGYIGIFNAVTNAAAKTRSLLLEENRLGLQSSQLDLENRRFEFSKGLSFQTFKQSLMSQGVDLSDINSWSEFQGFNPSSSASFNRARFQELVSTGQLTRENEALLSYLAYRGDGFSSVFKPVYNDSGDLVSFSLGNGLPSVQAGLRDIGSHQFELYNAQREFESKIEDLRQRSMRFQLLNDGEVRNQILTSSVDNMTAQTSKLFEEIQSLSLERGLTLEQILNSSQDLLNKQYESEILSYQTKVKKIEHDYIQDLKYRSDNGDYNAQILLNYKLSGMDKRPFFEKQLGFSSYDLVNSFPFK